MAIEAIVSHGITSENVFRNRDAVDVAATGNRLHILGFQTTKEFRYTK